VLQEHTATFWLPCVTHAHKELLETCPVECADGVIVCYSTVVRIIVTLLNLLSIITDVVWNSGLLLEKGPQ